MLKRRGERRSVGFGRGERGHDDIGIEIGIIMYFYVGTIWTLWAVNWVFCIGEGVLGREKGLGFRESCMYSSM